MFTPPPMPGENADGYSRTPDEPMDLMGAMVTTMISTHRVPVELASQISYDPDALLSVQLRGGLLGVEVPDGLIAEHNIVLSIYGAAALVAQIMDCYDVAGLGVKFTARLDQARAAARAAGVGENTPRLVTDEDV